MRANILKFRLIRTGMLPTIAAFVFFLTSDFSHRTRRWKEDSVNA